MKSEFRIPNSERIPKPEIRAAMGARFFDFRSASPQPGGLPEISRGLRSAATTPPEQRPKISAPRRGARGVRVFQRVWHPSGVQSDFRFVIRGCRFAQPPANLCQPSGLKASGQKRNDRTSHQASCSYETGEQVSDAAAAAIVELMNGRKPRWVVDEVAKLRAKLK